MPTYKLIYFNFPGLGEPLRFLLHQVGIKFEDKRLTLEEWPQVKNDMPMGQVPVLEIDGKPYYQSKAIGRLIAKRNNLYGSNDVEAYEIDATVDTIDDMRLTMSQYFWEKEAAFKEKLKGIAYSKRSLTLQKLEEQVKKNGGYLVGGKLSWADVLMTAMSEPMTNVVESDALDGYPELKKVVEKVRALPNIKAYLEKRPKGIF